MLAIQSDDGSRLEAAMVPPAGAARGVAVMCHPFLKYGLHYFFKNGLAEMASASGLHVLTFNFKGFGRSSLNGPVFADDVVGAVRHARRTWPSLSVYVIGLSFGGYHAVHALRRINGEVAGALLDSVPVSATNFFRTPLVSFAMRALSRSRWAQSLGIASLREVIADVETPLYFLHGSADCYSAPDEISLLARRAPSASVTEVDGAGHLECFRRAGDTYRSVIDVMSRANSN
jgi:pimeloyl-ACP methyl ester carboxylesterase